MGLKGLSYAFYNAKNLIEAPTVLPTTVTNLDYTFYGCTNFNYDISGWDVSNVTTMYWTFLASGFNQDIGVWDVGNVTNMQGMFSSSAFNQDIGGWNVGNVTNMIGMFENSPFNQDIGGWNVSNVTDMVSMFQFSPFNQDIGGWNVSNVINMDNMFASSAFNQDLNLWNVGHVTNMSSMFSGASSFNGNIKDWNVSNVTNMSSMFAGATAFNQDISSWNVGNVTDMSSMFSGATAFNQNINSWNVGNVTDMRIMFYNATSFNQNISGWNLANVTSTRYMFYNATAFNQNIGSWNVGLVTDMTNIFDGVTLSTTNYDALLIGWAAQTLQPNVTFSGGNSKYSCGAATTARATLTGGANHWTITDGGLDDLTPVLTIVNPDAACGSVDITSNAVITGNTNSGTLSYWEDAGATTTPLASPSAVATSGTYYIKSANSCGIDIEPVVVTINPPAPVLTIVDPGAACGSVDITSNAVITGNTNSGTLSYWEDATATTTPLANPSAVTASGTYYIKSMNTCGSDIEAVLVTINPPAPILTIVDPSAACGSVDITSNAVITGNTNSGTLTYWTDAGATNDLTNPTTVGISGTYYIKSTNVCGSDIEPVNVSVSPLPEKPIIADNSVINGSKTICPDEKIVCSNFNASLTYQWLIDGNELTGQTSDEYTVASDGAGIYTLNVTNDITGCENISDPLTIDLFVVENPDVYEKKEDGVISILVVDNTNGLYASYLWTYADGSTLPSDLPNNRQFLVLSGASLNGQYTVQTTDNNGCSGLSDMKSATVSNLVSKIYPTINHGDFNLDIVGEQTGKVNISIYNQSGVALKNYSYEKIDKAGSFQIFGTGLAPGSYHVVISIDNVRKTHKIVVQ